MHQLLLLRHAKADAAAADRDRPLSPAGRRAAVAIRGVMRDLGLAPDLVLVSDARRTMETLEALEPWDDTPLIEPLASLYLADARQLLVAIRDVAETVRGVLLIGHNPGLEELAVVLASGAGGELEAARRLREGFPTAAL
ncbi:MAG: histidine phosphatase family protein, partial [Acetobacteraceae bacterium]